MAPTIQKLQRDYLIKEKERTENIKKNYLLPQYFYFTAKKERL